MNTITRFFPWALLVAIQAACSAPEGTQGSDVGTLQVALEQVFAIGSLEDAMFGRLEDADSDALGFTYVVDRANYQLIKISPDGEVIGRTGTRGNGPGEFASGLRFVSVHGDEVVAMEGDVGSRRLHIYDRDLSRVDTVVLPEDVRPTNGFVHTDGGRVALLASSLALGTSLKVSDDAFSFTDLFPFTSASTGMWNNVSMESAGDQTLVVAYNFLNRIEVIGATGSVQTVFSVPGLPEKADSAAIDPALKEANPGLTLSSFPTKLVTADVGWDSQRALIYVQGGHHAVHPHRDLYVFDQSGVFQATVTLPDISPGRLFYVDDRGHVYVDGNGITLYKYRLVYGS